MQNLKSFNLLMETVFCRLLLLNRKRVGELQRMKLQTYEHSEELKTPNYEEFSDAITPTEKILLKSLKRVVIHGKRGRGVPVLFSEDIQNHMTLLLEARPNFLKTNNVFLFSNPKSNQPIVGYKILQKHAHLCGAKNPNALTSTKLHDVFQTAKIAKLLMLMEKGEAGKYKGKTLEEINLNMEEEIDNKGDDQLEDDDELATRNNLDEELLHMIHENQENECPTQLKCTTNKDGKIVKRVLVPWTTSQRKTVLQFFKNHIKNEKPPKNDECNTLIKKSSSVTELQIDVPSSTTHRKDITNTNLSVELDGPSNEFQKNNVNANQQLEVNVPMYTEFQKDIVNTNQPRYKFHLDEIEVKDYLKFPKNTKEDRQTRRNILALLRYEVKFEEYVQTEEFQPDKLPCAHCKRIIAAKYLRRHYKNCIVHPINETGRNIHHRAASQTLLACANEHANVTATLRVKKEVFSKMASDNIGFLERKDSLIRHFGEFYLKKPKQAQISHACSNNMRECSRLLIEMRRRTGNPNFSFFQLLNPTLFDDVILGAKTISGYDDTRKNL
ncbi:hypothetical protein FQA39_LY14664 [Lamprigera yunnana]|nr:hypothetical protein FQA39_LY14664 [Lamprigera yunnana]